MRSTRSRAASGVGRCGGLSSRTRRERMGYCFTITPAAFALRPLAVVFNLLQAGHPRPTHQTTHSPTHPPAHPPPPQGWNWFEDAQKPGFVAPAAGATLTLNVGPTFVALSVSALRSHRDSIGNLLIQCVKGCECEDKLFEGHWDITANVMFQK